MTIKNRNQVSKPKYIGHNSRFKALEIVTRVVHLGRPLDEVLELLEEVDGKDRGFTKALATETLRRFGSLEFILEQLLEKPLPETLPRLTYTLMLGMVQVLFLETADHAAINETVEMVKRDGKTKGFAGVVNAILRRAQKDKEVLLAKLPQDVDLPVWLQQSWEKAYGREAMLAMALQLREPKPLDIRVKSSGNDWALRIGAEVLPNGTLRLLNDVPIPQIEGYDDGEWIIQDAAAAMPVILLAPQKDERILDLCAAPGGKTAQLLWAGAKVTALDRSKQRLNRLQENLSRLNLKAETVVGDAAKYKTTDLYDAILLDAPCSATGTLRSNPDISLLKSMKDVLSLQKVQQDMLVNAASLLKTGGRLIFCTCSLQKEEGEMQIDFVKENIPSLAFKEFSKEMPYYRSLLTAFPNKNPKLSGGDGFFAAQFIKI